jgi:hypothetical protein
MRRALVGFALAAAVSTGGCNFAVKRPAVTAGIVAGSLGLGTCELASDEHAKCFALSGAAGLGLGLVTALALWLGTYEDDGTGTAPDGRPVGVDPTNLPPAPVFLPPSAPEPEPEPAPVPAPDAP